MQTGMPVAARRRKGVNTPGWIVLGILLSGGLFLFAWLALVGRRVLPGPAHMVLWMLPVGALLWISGASLMVKGAMAPTIPGQTGNPLFLAGFTLATICLILMLVFSNTFTRQLSPGGKATPIHARVIGFTVAVTGFLLSQLITEMTPVAPQNGDILVLFQLICIMVASVVGIQWVERVHAKHTEALGSTPTATVSPSANVESAQRF
ncbi:MAG TPA: hypothetical protein VGB18_04465 [Candidatus Thermoplasmatota archaeon]